MIIAIAVFLPLPSVKKYKAFHAGRLDLRWDVYEYCDLYEMHTVRYPLHTRNFLYCQEHPTEKSVITVTYLLFIHHSKCQLCFDQMYVSDVVVHLINRHYVRDSALYNNIPLKSWIEHMCIL